MKEGGTSACRNRVSRDRPERHTIEDPRWSSSDSQEANRSATPRRCSWWNGEEQSEGRTDWLITGNKGSGMDTKGGKRGKKRRKWLEVREKEDKEGRQQKERLSLSMSFRFREQLPQLRRDATVEDVHSATPVRATLFIGVRFTVIGRPSWIFLSIRCRAFTRVAGEWTRFESVSRRDSLALLRVLASFSGDF